MPRTARIISTTGIYHVMLRGVNCQTIFYEEEDYQFFMHLLEHYKRVSGFELYAFCLMGNHVHLLMKETGEKLSQIFKRIGAAFAYWYNVKYNRSGHVFQDRFRSEAVETPRYLVTVLRYIIQNPVAAGLVDSPEEYVYSSAQEYLNGSRGLTDTARTFQLIDRAGLADFLILKNDDECMDMALSVRRGVTDAAAMEMVSNEFGSLAPDPGAAGKREDFAESVRRLFRRGISIRQLSRITGISRGILQQYSNRDDRG